jgi:Peptidase_C39 like family
MRARVLPFVTARTLAALALATLTLAGAVSAKPAAATGNADHLASTHRFIHLDRWRGAGLAAGTFTATRLTDSSVRIGSDTTEVRYRDPFGSGATQTYDRGRWTSPWVSTPWGFTELVASYDADTPAGTFSSVAVRGRTTSGLLSSWDNLGRWASYDGGFHRMSLGSQTDDAARVNVDTWHANGSVRFGSWQLLVNLYRLHGTDVTPAIRRVGAMSSRLPSGSPQPTAPRSTTPVDLPVPRYSQEIHTGQLPQYDGGGEAWCSPTSTSMVLAYWHAGPTAHQYSWVPSSYQDPWVDYAARGTYDAAYDGTGNWPFNTAYAGRFDKLDAFVTRLHSLRDAELLVRAGIPIVASIAFGPGELDGAPISSSAGHLLVIRGFTAHGNVIVNDPAARSNATVRRVYKRAQFEHVWLPTSGGTVYVIHPPGRAPLPDPALYSAW